MTLVATACIPYFATGSVLSIVTVDGQYVTISWTAATATGDPIDPVASYQVEVNGEVVASIPAPTTTCTLTALGYDTTYDVKVTAYDDGGQWSGNAGGANASFGYVENSFATGSTGIDEGDIGCVDPTDTDGDRIPNAAETNTGTFVDAGDTGTNPLDGDTDDDGIRDGDDTIGTAAGLDLGYIGTNPLRQDILMEFDWFVDANDCASHSHQPSAAAIGAVQTMFADAPTTNPDGSTGINLIADYGQGGYGFTGGNLIADADGVLSGRLGAEFYNYKAANLDANRSGYYHYVILPHRYDTNSGSSGIAEGFGDDLVVSLQCYNSTSNVSKTIAHELGHNLGLGHGGSWGDSNNYKPNYNSVLNYEFQFPGVDSNCVPGGDGGLDYSSGVRADLVESNLDESDGLCSGVDVDWDFSGGISSGVSADINPYRSSGGGNGSLGTLSDHDDWGNLYLLGINDADGAPVGPSAVRQIIEEQPVPVEFQD